MHNAANWYVLIGVEEEVLTLLLPYYIVIPFVSQYNQRMIMILPFPTIALWIYWGDCSSGRYLLSITSSYTLLPIGMVWLVLRRRFLHYSHRIFLFLFFLKIICVWLWYSLSQHPLDNHKLLCVNNPTTNIILFIADG